MHGLSNCLKNFIEKVEQPWLTILEELKNNMKQGHRGTKQQKVCVPDTILFCYRTFRTKLAICRSFNTVREIVWVVWLIETVKYCN